jgi:hypothetical protein
LHCAHASTYNEYDVYQDGNRFRIEVKARRWQQETASYTEEAITSLVSGHD